MVQKHRRLIWLRAAAALMLVAIVVGTVGWWHLRHWQPPRAVFAMQGVEIGSTDVAATTANDNANNASVDWTALKAIGADFAYIDASAGAFAHDPDFSRNLEEARATGLQVGAVHRYDPCQPADKQAANFVTVVPRDSKMLPPAVELAQLATDCPVRVSDASVESELMTFLNEIETHTGKASLLKISPAFESRYHLARAIDRNLWLMGNRFQPDYAQRPWTLWTANDALQTTAMDKPLRWVVVQP
ncbi:MAG: glycoside hydrolase family 25 protein [Pseudomonadota bacterium]|nr:glycoside hydrolase family 25 protein [Pseudomonadota bacterium]